MAARGLRPGGAARRAPAAAPGAAGAHPPAVRGGAGAAGSGPALCRAVTQRCPAVGGKMSPGCPGSARGGANMAWRCWARAAGPRPHRYRRHGSARHGHGTARGGEGGKRRPGRALLTVRVFPPQAGAAAAAAAAGIPPGAAAARGAPGSRRRGAARAAVPAPQPLPARTRRRRRPPLAAPPAQAAPLHRGGKWLCGPGLCPAGERAGEERIPCASGKCFRLRFASQRLKGNARLLAKCCGVILG